MNFRPSSFYLTLLISCLSFVFSNNAFSSTSCIDLLGQQALVSSVSLLPDIPLESRSANSLNSSFDSVLREQVRKIVFKAVSDSFEKVIPGLEDFYKHLEEHDNLVINWGYGRSEALEKQNAFLDRVKKAIETLNDIERSGDTVEFRSTWYEAFSKILDLEIERLVNNPPSEVANSKEEWKSALESLYISKSQFMRLIEKSHKIYTRKTRSKLLTVFHTAWSKMVVRWSVPDDPLQMIAYPVLFFAGVGFMDPAASPYAGLAVGASVFTPFYVAVGARILNLPQRLLNIPRTAISYLRQRSRTNSITRSISNPVLEFIILQKLHLQSLERFVRTQESTNVVVPPESAIRAFEASELTPGAVDSFDSNFQEISKAYKLLSQLFLSQIFNVPHPFKQKELIIYEHLRLMVKDGESLILTSQEVEIIENESKRLEAREKIISRLKAQFESISKPLLELQNQLEKASLKVLQPEAPLVDSLRLERLGHIRQSVNQLLGSVLEMIRMLSFYEERAVEAQEYLSDLDTSAAVLNLIESFESLNDLSLNLEKELQQVRQFSQDEEE